MLLIYNIGICCYYIVIKIAALFNDKAGKWISGRHNYFLHLEDLFRLQSKPVIWMHCASLGEFEQGRPILEEIRKTFPNHFILLTFFSPSGFEIRKNYEGADHIDYLPLDTSANAKRFLDIVNPELAIFVKYEFWYHFLTRLQQRKIPTLLVSAIFREEQHFFRPWGGLFRKMLFCFTSIFVQEKESKDLLEEKLDLNNVILCGDTRVDRVLDIVKEERRFPLMESFVQDGKILICGSTWARDEELIEDWFRNANTSFKLIIAPHDISESRIIQIEQQFSGHSIRYSQLKTTKSELPRILIIDNIGMLSALYRYARIAYVGGGFGTSIHSILEPAAFALPICFGPNFHKFAEARQLVKRKGAFVVRQKGDLKMILDQLDAKENYEACRSTVRNFMEESRGATAQVMTYIEKLI